MAAAVADARDEFRGTDRFAIEERIGTGATGVVYRARDNERGRTVALKLLRRYDPLALYRFKQEFRALADVTHRNLVNLYELVNAGDEWFFTMELVEGEDFLTYVRGVEGERATAMSESASVHEEQTAETLSLVTVPAGAMATATAADGMPLGAVRVAPHIAPPVIERGQIERLRDTLAQLVDGLRALHAAGHLHRDVKPSNVLVTAAGRVVILDFGVVAELTPAGTGLREGRVVGTPAYMAPEQGAGDDVTPASDWYSVGVMLYEALTGRRPFVGPARDVIAAKQRRDPRPVAELNPDAPRDLAALCMDLLSRDPNRRPGPEEILVRAGRATRASQPRVARTTTAPVFVGRAGHIELLRSAFSAVAAGATRTAFVHGSSGVGKTALVNYFLDELRARGDAVVLTGRCYDRESVPYKALDDLIDELSRYLVDLPRRAVWDLMPPDVYALARLFPVLRRVEAIMGASRRDLDALEPHDLRRRAFDALRELLVRLGRQQPLVLFIDDIQWGDVDSARLLAHVTRPRRAPRVLLIGAYRREDAAASPLLRALLPTQGAALSLAVEPLSPQETEQLALSLLGGDGEVAGHLAQSIRREAGGNPFFVHEVVSWIRSQDDLTSIGHNLTLDQVLASRVAELSPPARGLLRVIAVAGRPIAQAVAARAARLGVDDAVALGELRAANLVHARGARDRDAIECFHDRVREAVLLSMSPDELRDTHARLAEVYEATGEGDAEALSIHLEHAGDVRRAADYSVEAAEAAMAALAFERAAHLYRRALALAKPRGEARAALMARLGDALAHAGRRSEAADIYREAAQLSGAAADRMELASRAAESYLWSGHVDEGIRALEGVLTEVGVRMPRTRMGATLSFLARRAWVRVRGLRFRERDPSSLSPHVLGRQNVLWAAAVGFAMCDLPLGMDFQARHLLSALSLGQRREVARALAVEASYRSLAGRKAVARARRIADRAMQIAEDLDDPMLVAWVNGAHAIASYQVGEFRDARDRAERALALLAGRHGASYEAAVLIQYRLWSLYWLGEWREMSRTVASALRDARERGDRYSMTNLAIGVPNAAWLVRDDPAEALRVCRDAIERWSRPGFHLQHYWEFLATLHAYIYAGDGARAAALVADRWRAVARAHLLRVSMVRAEASHARARAHILAAACGIDRDAHLAQAERITRAMERERLRAVDGLAMVQRAGIASVRGDADAAL
ncbi:MAG: hypothetical protein D6689_00385, partial [Deltaproteobacteria bacterium]